MSSVLEDTIMNSSAPIKLSILALAALIGGSSLAHPSVATHKAHKTTGKSKASKTTKTKAVKKAVKKIGTLYAIGYTHLDTQWCWTYPQVINEFIPNTLHDNFALFKKYPNYVFNWTGSNRYKFMQEYYPEDFATLKKYVASGNWFPAGSCVEEGDVNSPSEEGLIRQVMYANNYFRKEFGKASSEFMLPDCFGFPASLPSILAHCGLKGFSTQKLTWGSAVGIPFNVGEWIGPDNQAITAALNPDSYGSEIHDDLSSDKYWVGRMESADKTSGVPDDYRYYGTGDRGGAPDEQSVKDLLASENGPGPLKVVGGDADTMFNLITPAQKAVLPTYKGDLELTWHSAGSITSEAAMKRWNRKNELLADEAERSSVIANWMGAQPYPQDRITDAWLRFLPGQFHDLMAGTALPKAYNYTWNDEIIAMNESADVLQQSVGAMSRGLDTRPAVEGGASIVVFNPLSIERNGTVEATVYFPKGAPTAVNVLDNSGNVVPSQIVSSEKRSVKVVFNGVVPSVGAATFTVVPTEAATTVNTGLSVTANSLENFRYKVHLNEAGDVDSVFDKHINKELLAAPARLEFMHENPADWPAWNMDWEDQQKPPHGYVDGPAKIEIAENGASRVALKVTRHALGSTFVQTISLSAGDAGNRLQFATTVDWQGKATALKAAFPLTASNPLTTYNWELGTVQRTNDNPKKYEVPSHRWIDLTDTSGTFGASVLDDCKYGSDKPNDNTIRLTLVYTPGTHGGYEHQGTQDWGHNVMTYALEGHDGDWRSGHPSLSSSTAGAINPTVPSTQWEASDLNQPLVAFQVPAHEGSLGKSISFASVSTPQVSIEAMKKAELSGETIIRLNELNGEAAKHVELSFAAPVVALREVNGQELPISSTGPVYVKGGKVYVDMTAYRPRAFAIKFAQSKKMVAPVSSVVPLPYNLDVLSTWSDKTDGNFDGKGTSIPGELLPSTIDSGGVKFQFGPKTTGAKNAVECDGQTITVPKEKGAVYFIASSSDGDVAAKFGVGTTTRTLKIQNWDGFIGQWDNRLWGGVVPELTYSWSNPIIGLEPGFIKRDPVAWYADHKRLSSGVNDTYNFCYFFRYKLDKPAGVTTVTLPSDSRIKIMAMSVSNDANDVAHPAQPLYDVINLKERMSGDPTAAVTPTISPAGGSFDKMTTVSIMHPLYWSEKNAMHYTLDGSAPTAESPVYTHELQLDGPTDVKVAQISQDGKVGPIVEANFAINDTVAPEISNTVLFNGADVVILNFTKAIAASNLSGSFKVDQAGTDVTSAELSNDDHTVTLHLSKPVQSDSVKLSINGVTDQSPNHNPLSVSEVELKPAVPVYEAPSIMTFDGTRATAKNDKTTALPTDATSPWSINQWVYMDKEPAELTAISGFGDAQDNGGTQRYLVKFQGHIHFWGSNVDINAPVGFDLGKWQMITLTYDGKSVRIYKNGVEVVSGDANFSNAVNVVRFEPAGPWGNNNRFDGKISNFSIWSNAIPASMVKLMFSKGR